MSSICHNRSGYSLPAQYTWILIKAVISRLRFPKCNRQTHLKLSIMGCQTLVLKCQNPAQCDASLPQAHSLNLAINWRGEPGGFKQGTHQNVQDTEPLYTLKWESVESCGGSKLWPQSSASRCPHLQDLQQQCQPYRQLSASKSVITQHLEN